MSLVGKYSLEPQELVNQPVGRNGRLRRILIVDDDEYVALTLQRGLKKLPDCEVVAVTGAKQALRLFARQPFDLLITDYKMQGMDGIMLAACVQKLYPQTIAIMITGHGNHVLREQAAGVSIQCILDKPVKLTEIRNVASEALADVQAASSPGKGV